MSLVIPPHIDERGSHMRVGPDVDAGELVYPSRFDFLRGIGNNLVQEGFEQ